jgi:polyhydroxybutyrate depolymerase
MPLPTTRCKRPDPDRPPGRRKTLCTIDGGGHQWPGGESIGVFSGTLSTDLDATAAMWAFFAAHPRG